jgi:hypothetical protein
MTLNDVYYLCFCNKLAKLLNNLPLEMKKKPQLCVYIVPTNNIPIFKDHWSQVFKNQLSANNNSIMRLTCSKKYPYKHRLSEQIRRKEKNLKFREELRRRRNTELYSNKQLVTDRQYYAIIALLNELEAFTDFKLYWCPDYDFEKLLMFVFYICCCFHYYH